MVGPSISELSAKDRTLVFCIGAGLAVIALFAGIRVSIGPGVKRVTPPGSLEFVGPSKVYARTHDGEPGGFTEAESPLEADREDPE